MTTLQSPTPPGGRPTKSTDRRRHPRKESPRALTLRLTDAPMLAAGRDVSASGAYVVTGDEIPVEVLLESGGRETIVAAKLVRIDAIAHGTLGIALRFDRDLTPQELGE